MSGLPQCDEEAAAVLWSAYVHSRPHEVAAAETPVVVCLGDSAAMADELAELIVQGRKRATAGLVSEFRHEGEPLPQIGGHFVVCDGAGSPVVVVRSVELRLGPLDSVDDAFAWDEGEGDRSRTAWLSGHRAFFMRACAARAEVFTDEHEVIFERFTVVWPPRQADTVGEASSTRQLTESPTER